MDIQAGSMGIQVQKIVDILETEGEDEWATKIDEAYYSHFGIDAVRAALGRLRELQRDDDLLDRLEIRDTVAGVVSVFSLAAGEDTSQPTAATHASANQLLNALTGKDDEIVPPDAANAAGVRRLLDTLRDERG